uniref:Uncharacterized protein n=1 Tax=Ditylenchus dipsaci TaxID=166011 RepID=A0A915E8H7_9BILA
MALLSNNRLDALEKMSPYLNISQETGCFSYPLNYNHIVRHLDSLIASENFDAFEQVWNLIPKEKKNLIRLQNLPAKQMLSYALKLMDEGRTEEYKRIIDAFKNCNSFPNSDDFFFYFIEEYFKRQNKPIDVVEAFSIYMKHLQVCQGWRLSKHIYDIILDTIEQNLGKYERNIFQQQVLADVIGGQVFAAKKPSKDKRQTRNQIKLRETQKESG